MADLNGATYALAAVNAALFQRTSSGRGQRLDVSLAESTLHGINPRLAMFHQLKADTLEQQRAIAQRRPAYGAFECCDGGWITVGALEDHFWLALVNALDLQTFAGEEWRTYAQRQRQTESINAAIAAVLAKLSRIEAIERLVARDVPVAEVWSPSELTAHPQWIARGLFIETPGGPQVRFPVRMDQESA